MQKINLLIILQVIFLLLIENSNNCNAQDRLAVFYIGGSSGEMTCAEYQISYSLGIPAAIDEMSSELFTAVSGYTALADFISSIFPSKIIACKFYDANANGINDDGFPLKGWLISLNGDASANVMTNENGNYVFEGLIPGNYTVSESTPVESNWVATKPMLMNLTLGLNEIVTIEFGNVCIGGGGGESIGFWSNKNGQKILQSNDPAWRNLLNNSILRNGDGTQYLIPAFGDFGNAFSSFRTWLLRANASNMSYALSAQLAAMKLNTNFGNVDDLALVYTQVSSLTDNFISVSDLILKAESELNLHGTAYGFDHPLHSTTPWWQFQADLKDVLDRTNNNLIFVQDTPGPFSFDQIQPSMSIKEQYISVNQIPDKYSLAQNFPNPFNPTTVINYTLPSASHTKLVVYNILGQEVSILIDEILNAGYHSVSFNAGQLTSGIYFYYLKTNSIENPAESFVSVKKMILIK
jgi:hypothetical protein